MNEHKQRWTNEGKKNTNQKKCGKASNETYTREGKTTTAPYTRSAHTLDIQLKKKAKTKQLEREKTILIKYSFVKLYVVKFLLFDVVLPFSCTMRCIRFDKFSVVFPFRLWCSFECRATEKKNILTHTHTPSIPYIQAFVVQVMLFRLSTSMCTNNRVLLLLVVAASLSFRCCKFPLTSRTTQFAISSFFLPHSMTPNMCRVKNVNGKHWRQLLHLHSNK